MSAFSLPPPLFSPSSSTNNIYFARSNRLVVHASSDGELEGGYCKGPYVPTSASEGEDEGA